MEEVKELAEGLGEELLFKGATQYQIAFVESKG